MEVLIISAIVYLALCALKSPLLFASQTTFLILSFCALAIYLMSGYGIILAVYSIAVLTSELYKLRPSLAETLVFVLILVGSSFWLGMREFVDGYLYSYVIVAVCIAVFSRLAIGGENCRILSLLCLCLGKLLTYPASSPSESVAFLSAFLILYMLTQNFVTSETERPYENDERYRRRRYLSPAFK